MGAPAAALRLVVVDPTDGVDVGAFLAWARAQRVAARERGRRDGTAPDGVGLSPIWRAGARLYASLGQADATAAASSWREALRFAADASARAGVPIASLQVWGHGGFGFMKLGASRLDAAALRPGAGASAELSAVRDALAPDALVWLRCCSAFGHDAGRAFASGLADRLRARVAGHTHIIGFWQSGSHALAPGATPAWSPREGVRFEGDVAVAAQASSPSAPNTITALATTMPAGW